MENLPLTSLSFKLDPSVFQKITAKSSMKCTCANVLSFYTKLATNEILYEPSKRCNSKRWHITLSLRFFLCSLHERTFSLYLSQGKKKNQNKKISKRYYKEKKSIQKKIENRGKPLFFHKGVH